MFKVIHRVRRSRTFCLHILIAHRIYKMRYTNIWCETASSFVRKTHCIAFYMLLLLLEFKFGLILFFSLAIAFLHFPCSFIQMYARLHCGIYSAYASYVEARLDYNQLNDRRDFWHRVKNCERKREWKGFETLAVYHQFNCTSFTHSLYLSLPLSVCGIETNRVSCSISNIAHRE